jgi:hypothetical protein
MIRHCPDCGADRRFAPVHAGSADRPGHPVLPCSGQICVGQGAVYRVDFVSCVHGAAAGPDIRDRAA